MRRLAATLLATSALALGANAPHAPAEPAHPPAQPAHGAPTTTRSHGATLPGFAAELAQRPIPSGSGWHVLTHEAAWVAIAAAPRERRQAARWDYAASLIGEGRYPEALGVLQVMVADEADLKLVAAFQLAQGIALAGADRPRDALAALAAPDLVALPEACAWRVVAHQAARQPVEAMRQVDCALPAVNARAGEARIPFVMAAARAAFDAGRMQQAITWLGAMPDTDAAANLLRGRAHLALGQAREGRLRLERAELAATGAELRAEIRLARIEMQVAQSGIKPDEAIKRLEALRFGWRRTEIEERALRLAYRLATETHDPRATLRSGATLLRYFDLGRESAAMLGGLRATLAAMLAPDSGVPVADAAGLYWEFRELAPAGAEGDALAARLADRLEQSGLPARAAELLGHQLEQRAEDVARGPLSAKVASLWILAGQPAEALRALQNSEGPNFTPAMIAGRKQMEAIALFQQGKADAALAALDQVPGSGALRTELLWRQRRWGALAAATALPAPKALSEADQVVVLRLAIALSMQGQEQGLQALRTRYAGAFAGLKTAAAFDVLTHAPGSVDPAAVSNAMDAVPSASPAGALADLLDAAPGAQAKS